MARSSLPPLSRSDQIRLKRAVRTQDQAQQSTQQGYRPPRDRKPPRAASRNAPRKGMPSILTRSALGTSVLKRTSTVPRRKVSIPMNTPGTEMILPSLPFANPSWRMLSGFWLLLSMAVILVISYDPMYRVSDIRLEGIESINPGDVQMYAGLRGQRAYAINPAAIEDRLQRAFPELLGVSVRVGMPAGVIISGTEREPVIEWQFRNEVLLINRDGYIFPQRGYVEQEGLLVVVSDMAPPAPPPELLNDIEEIRQEVALWETGATIAQDPLKQERADPALVEAALNLQSYIPPDTALIFSHYDGLGWSDTRGWNVYVGLNLDEITFKMAEYQAIVDHLEQKGIRPRMISVEHVHAPFYRLE
jgi:hypothetical protein